MVLMEHSDIKKSVQLSLKSHVFEAQGNPVHLYKVYSNMEDRTMLYTFKNKGLQLNSKYEKSEFVTKVQFH